MFFGALLSGLFAKLAAVIGAAFLGLAAAPGGAGSSVTHPTTSPPSTGVSGSVNTHDTTGSDTSATAKVPTSEIPGIAGISSALSGLGTGVSSCVMNALSSAGGVSSADTSALMSQVTTCVTSALNAAALPGGAGTCASAIMSTVDSAAAGKTPSFNISDCIPSGLASHLPSLGGSTGSTAGGSLPDLSGLSSTLSGLGTGVVSCVLNALSTAGTVTSANSPALASDVTTCVTSSLNSAKLPGGSSSCASAIMSSIESATAGKNPSFNISDCIPSGLPGLAGIHAGSGSGTAGLPSRIGGLAKLFSGGFPGLGSGGFGFGSPSAQH